ncbi:unnamed protein product [Closterium sp. NIES-53]
MDDQVLAMSGEENLSIPKLNSCSASGGGSCVVENAKNPTSAPGLSPATTCVAHDACDSNFAEQSARLAAGGKRKLAETGAAWARATGNTVGDYTDGSWDPVTSLASIRHEFGEHGGVNMSIENSATFTVMEPESMAKIFTGQLGPDNDFFVYSRHFNPTVMALGRQLAALEGTESAYCTASGMAAISAAVLQLCKHGDRIVASNRLYGGTFAFLDCFLPRMAGIRTTFVDITDLAAVEAALSGDDEGPTCELVGSTAPGAAAAVRPIAQEATDDLNATDVCTTPLPPGADSLNNSARDGEAVPAGPKRAGPARLLFFETISNPTLVVADVPALAAAAHRHGAAVVVDNTFAPVLVSPAKHGADVVVHSLSKFMSGASDVIAGCVCGSAAFIASLMSLTSGSLMLLGATMNPQVAFNLSARLPHLPLRMREHGRRALLFASRMHALGLPVCYPGLPSHPQAHVLARISNGSRPHLLPSAAAAAPAVGGGTAAAGSGVEVGGSSGGAEWVGPYAGGGMLSLDLGSTAMAYDFMRHLQNNAEFGYMAVSLGFHDSLVSCSGASTSSEMRAEQRQVVGISPGLVRMSVGYTGSEEQRWTQLLQAASAVWLVGGEGGVKRRRVAGEAEGEGVVIGEGVVGSEDAREMMEELLCLFSQRSEARSKAVRVNVTRVPSEVLNSLPGSFSLSADAIVIIRKFLALTRMVTFEEDGGVRSERGHDHRVILREDEDRVELRRSEAAAAAGLLTAEEALFCACKSPRRPMSVAPALAASALLSLTSNRKSPGSSGGGGGGERPERAAGGAASSHGAGLPGDEGEGSAVSGCSAEGEAQDYLALLEAHMQAGSDGRFAARQLMQLAAVLVDALADVRLCCGCAASRQAAARSGCGGTCAWRNLRVEPQEALNCILVPAAAHPSPLVRAEAVAALHAFALLHAPSARSHLPLLHAAPRESAHPGVQMAAVRALADLLLWHRSAALLPDVAAPGLTLQRAGGARGGGRAVAEGSVDVLLGLVPLAGGQVDIEAVREDVEHAGRQAEGEDEGEAEGVVGVVGEWLCKLLLADASRGEEGGVERGAEVRVERVVQVLLVEVYLCSESCTCVRAPLKTSCPGHVNSSRAVLAELFNRRGRAASLQGGSVASRLLLPVLRQQQLGGLQCAPRSCCCSCVRARRQQHRGSLLCAPRSCCSPSCSRIAPTGSCRPSGKGSGKGESSSIRQPVGFESLALDLAAEVLSSPLASAGSASGKAYSAHSEPLSCSWRCHSGPPSRTTSNAFASAMSDNLVQPPPPPLPAAMLARRAVPGTGTSCLRMGVRAGANVRVRVRVRE